MVESDRKYLALVKETLEFYSNNPRSKTHALTASCRYTYKRADGVTLHCAVGRCCTPEGQVELAKHEGASIRCVVHEGFPLDTHLKPEYAGLSLENWLCIQQLHDTSYYWYREALVPTYLTNMCSCILASYTGKIASLTSAWIKEWLPERYHQWLTDTEVQAAINKWNTLHAKIG